MRKIAIASFVAAALILPAAFAAPGMPGPAKEHEWLQGLAGQWDSEIEVSTGPGVVCSPTRRAVTVDGTHEPLPLAPGQRFSR